MLEGEVVLVTGAGSGLGRATSERLGAEGAVVVAADIDVAGAKATADAVESGGGRAIALELDVSNAVSVDDAVDRLGRELGGIDALVNNAGIDVTAPVTEITPEEWDRILGVNLTGPFLLARKVLPLMRRAGRGHIVNIVSTAARRAWANASAYHASKWGLLGLSHALHVEARGHGVKVTALIAGGMRTPFLLDRFPDIDTTTLQDPANVAETIRFLLTMPTETVIPEVMVIPMGETSWP